MPRSTVTLPALTTSCAHEADAVKAPLTFNTFVTVVVLAGSPQSSDPDERMMRFIKDVEETRFRVVDIMHDVIRLPLSHHGSDAVTDVGDADAVKEDVGNAVGEARWNSQTSAAPACPFEVAPAMHAHVASRCEVAFVLL